MTSSSKTIVLSAVIAALLSGAAFAGVAAPVANASSDAQLAASAGVQPGVYTAAELQAIIDAKRDNDSRTANYFISGANRANPAQNTDSVGLEQLARAAGVQPGQYTQAELVGLIEAQKENDAVRVEYWLSHANRNTPDTASNPGKIQLAKTLGVNPDDYSLSELVLMQSSISD